MTIVVAQSILIITLGIGKLNPAEEIGIIQCAALDYPKIISQKVMIRS